MSSKQAKAAPSSTASNARPGRPPDPAKQRAILDAARSLLFQGGPGELSMEAVARRAGVSKVTIYARYANREALLDAVIGDQANNLMDSLNLQPEDASSARKALCSFGQQLLSFVLGEEHQGFLRLVLASPASSQAILARIYRSGPEATHAQLEHWMTRADAAGLLRIPDPPQSTELLIGMLLGLELIRLLYGQPAKFTGESLETHVEQVVDRFLSLHGT